MIVLDEQLIGRGIESEIARWYPGSVSFIHKLRPAGIVKDDSIPTLLTAIKQPTFVTINVTDFWNRIAVSKRFCIVCVAVPDPRTPEIPGLLRSLLRRPEFRTKSLRMGKVIRISSDTILYYTVDDPTIRAVDI